MSGYIPAPFLGQTPASPPTLCRRAIEDVWPSTLVRFLCESKGSFLPSFSIMYRAGFQLICSVRPLEHRHPLVGACNYALRLAPSRAFPSLLMIGPPGSCSSSRGRAPANPDKIYVPHKLFDLSCSSLGGKSRPSIALISSGRAQAASPRLTGVSGATRASSWWTGDRRYMSTTRLPLRSTLTTSSPLVTAPP